MKKFFMLAMLSCSIGFCCQEFSTGKLTEGKFYPYSENIHVDQNGIYVNFEGSVCKVESLFSDAKGVYVLAPVNDWKCPNGHPNPPWSDKCALCPFTR